jgi:hypothetical protein
MISSVPTAIPGARCQAIPARGIHATCTTIRRQAGADQLTLRFGHQDSEPELEKLIAVKLAEVLKEQGLSEQGAFSSPKGKRISLFIQVLKKLPPADSFEAAHQQIALTMHAIEQKARDYGLETMWVLENHFYCPAGTNARFSYYKKHTNIIGENGAMAFYNGDNDRIEDPTWFQNQKPDFEKSGQDGNDVWGNPRPQTEPKNTLRFGLLVFDRLTQPAHHRSSGKG